MTWQDRAACARLDWYEAERMFFGRADRDLFEGRRMCQTCPVILECRALADQLETGFLGNRHHAAGIWGGEFVTERIARRNRALEQAS